jgi:ribosomal protein L34E
MTQYLKPSFTIYPSKTPAKAKCHVCGVDLPVVTRKRNGKPECPKCFRKPKI